MLYSKSTGGFYRHDIHGENIPEDVVDITDEEHAALLEGQSQGKRIVADENGYPVLVDQLPLTVDQKLSNFERELDSFLDAKAQELTFKDRHSLALRAAYPNPWQALGSAFGAWMDACNILAWQGKQAILAGTKPMPSNTAEFLAELPPFIPPEV